MNQLNQNIQNIGPGQVADQDMVLLIDDQEPIRLYIKTHLDTAGYRVIEAQDGEEGYRLFLEHQPPVVLLDLRMPLLDGMGFLSRLEKKHHERSHFIVLSAHGQEESLEQVYQMGVQAFLPKPVEKQALLGTVASAIQIIRAQEKIQNLNDRLVMLLRNLPCVVWEAGPDLTFTHLSGPIEQFFGYQLSEMIDHPMLDFIDKQDQEEFRLKTTETQKGNESGYSLKKNVAQAECRFQNKSGQAVPMRLKANARLDPEGRPIALVGIMEDISKITVVKQSLLERDLQTTIEINRSLKIVSAESELEKYFRLDPDEQGEYHRPHIRDYLMDKDLEQLIEFAFVQREDIPFPIELELKDPKGQVCQFQISFTYDEARGLLHGQSIPASAEDGMVMLNRQVEQEQEKLSKAVVVDEDIQKSIFKDCDNLISELIALLRKLEPNAYEEVDCFTLEEFSDFIKKKNLFDYQENLRFFANKLHGLKGTAGFLAPGIKDLCHRSEEIVKPLADLRLVYTSRLGRFLKDFILYVQDLLDQYQKSPDSLSFEEDWPSRIDQECLIAEELIGGEVKELQSLIKNRCKDSGQLRKRENEQSYISVHKESYHNILKYMRTLFYGLVKLIPQSEVIQVNNLFNNYVVLHQEAQHIPLNLSRYDRLVPSLAQEYSKKAEFRFTGQEVKADVEFWNSLHEIINHCVKNAIVHGLEEPNPRIAQDKKETGLITVELAEDSMHIYMNVKDDGRGLNPDKIKEKVLSQGLLPLAQLEGLQDEEVFQLLFLQGVSTAHVVDQNAGRGVGLNAVQEAMKKQRGSCIIQSAAQLGSNWQFTFTKSNVSLPCVVIRIGDYMMAIPENSIDKFEAYDPDKEKGVQNGTCWEEGREYLPMIQTEHLFSEQVAPDTNFPRLVMVLKNNRKSKYVFVVNEILMRASLPLSTIGSEYDQDLYLGTALYKGNPIMVYNCDCID